MTNDPNIIKVSATSRAVSVAGSIAARVREHGSVIVQAVGASAVNQAVKSIIVARMYLVQDGIDIAMIPGFVDVQIDGVEKTGIRIEIVKQQEVIC